MNSRSQYLSAIRDHYQRHWGFYQELKWPKGPTEQLPEQFTVLQFAPTERRSVFTFATCGMSEAGDADRMECFLLSPVPDESICELLTVIAWFHRRRERLDWGHTVNFGRPWLPQSPCDHGLFSYPYLDGPELQWLNGEIGPTQFLWLIPITTPERDFKINQGLEALEKRFESCGFDYANPLRESVVDDGEGAMS